MTRRELITLMVIAGQESSRVQTGKLVLSVSDSGWKKYLGNPVPGGQYGASFDVWASREEGRYRMWVSGARRSIALTKSACDARSLPSRSRSTVLCDDCRIGHDES